MTTNLATEFLDDEFEAILVYGITATVNLIVPIIYSFSMFGFGSLGDFGDRGDGLVILTINLYDILFWGPMVILWPLVSFFDWNWSRWGFVYFANLNWLGPFGAYELISGMTFLLQLLL